VNSGLGPWRAVAALALWRTGLAYMLYFRFNARVGPAQVISVPFLVPAFAMLWAGVFVGEARHAWHAGAVRLDPARHPPGRRAAATSGRHPTTR
jgi:drug/metabolite transporter (DMT)-like permease